MKFAQSFYYSFSFLLMLYSSPCLAETINQFNQNIEDYDCISAQEESEPLFPLFDLAIESFESDVITQFIEDFSEEDAEEDSEELELPDDLDETYICDLEVLI